MSQLNYRAVGNPITTLPLSAVSNCWPGLEFDFKGFWRRSFVGLTLLECDNYVVAADSQYENLVGHRLLMVDDRPTVTTVTGPQMPGQDPVLLTSASNPGAVAFMEWSNTLAYVMQKQGQSATCYFTEDVTVNEEPIPVDDKGNPDKSRMLAVTLTVQQMLVPNSAAPSAGLLNPGEMTQGLCSPWQHDYRECACYYWAATRPDFVNTEATPEGISDGDNWLSKKRTGHYVSDDRHDSLFVTYDDLFQAWEKMLHFEVQGRDATSS
jgi:hypothetical protein